MGKLHGHWALDTEQSGWTLDTEEWWLDIGTRASARLAEESLDLSLSSPVMARYCRLQSQNQTGAQVCDLERLPSN